MRKLTDELAAEGLSKRYRRDLVVDDVSFRVRRGRITAFLGPNGAGKTTTMRMLAGLSRPDRGTSLLDGRPVRRIPNLGRHLGLLLDASAIHGGRTVRESMRIVTHTIGVPASRGDDLLEAVGIGSVMGRRAGALSLGMRQRMGIAVALAGAPDYLVLDEPMNGLDTEGIGWLKDLLREFAETGGGILLSTHLIGEVQGLADQVVVINRGRLVTEARPGQIGAAESLVRSADDARMVSALVEAGFTARQSGSVVMTNAAPEQAGHVALQARIALIELREVTPDLAQYVRDNTDGEFAATGARRQRSAQSHPASETERIGS